MVKGGNPEKAKVALTDKDNIDGLSAANAIRKAISMALLNTKVGTDIIGDTTPIVSSSRPPLRGTLSILDIIKQMVSSFFELKNINSSEILSFLKKIREYFYILFITNLDIKKILNHFLTEFISKVDDLNLKFEIINIISEYEVRICEGTRYIVHVEAMMIKLLRLLYSSKVIGL